MLSPLLHKAIVLLAIVVIASLVKLFFERRRFTGLPGPPHHWLYGHLPVFNQIKAQLPADAHINLIHATLARKYDLDPIFYLDLWPRYDHMVIVTEPALAAQVTQLKDLPKHPMYRLMEYTVGTQSIITTHGAHWRLWRKVFDPGFSSAHLATLTPMVIERVQIFIEKLETRARAGEVFSLLPLTKSLTLDIIGRVTMASDFNTQKQSHEIVDAFLEMPKHIPPVGFDPVRLLNPSRIWNAWKYQKKLNELIGQVVESRFEERKQGKVGSFDKSIVHLALDTYEKMGGSETAHDRLDPVFKVSAVDNIRGFFFAGHATTAASLCYLYYVLDKYPDVKRRLCEEHVSYLGPDPTSTAQRILEEPTLLKRMPYTTAVIKESLRLFVGAGTIRNGVKGFDLIDPRSNKSYPTYVNGPFPILVRAFPLHRNPANFPEPDLFDPERFLGDRGANMKKDAYRPFEKGPRDCPGQELSMMEMRITLALTVRRLEIQPVYGEDMPEVLGDKAYNVMFSSAGPAGGLPVRVKVA
ncbi:AflN/verA/monooxygenase [Phlyctema vagabunda]|uniref:AflN/verA/monooxygenase n=1 Tax=Phlyctema vagabunda TaxID=108571 RepID=A0ABR4PED1_9HELO